MIDKLELEPIEYRHSAVEDSVLIAVLSFYSSHLSIIEALEIKDKLLYEGDEYYKVMPNDGLSRSSTPLFERGLNLEYRYSSGAGVP